MTELSISVTEAMIVVSFSITGKAVVEKRAEPESARASSQAKRWMIVFSMVIAFVEESSSFKFWTVSRETAPEVRSDADASDMALFKLSLISSADLPGAASISDVNSH